MPSIAGKSPHAQYCSFPQSIREAVAVKAMLTSHTTPTSDASVEGRTGRRARPMSQAASGTLA